MNNKQKQSLLTILPIHAAVVANDIQRLESLLKHPQNSSNHGRDRRRKTSIIDLMNEKDVFGRTALHVAVSLNRVKAVKSLVAVESVNVNIQDQESGWTPLHRALYHGFIQIASILLTRADIDVSIRDRENLAAFQLYNVVLSKTIDVVDKNNVCNDVLYTWGKNTNLVLGVGDGDDRSLPSRIELNKQECWTANDIFSRNLKILHVSMSKFHSAIVTNELKNNLRICGFGRGGRLGNQSDASLFHFQPVDGINGRVIHVACGQDHTIAVTDEGHAWSFGRNSFGQLGYPFEEGEQCQSTPRQIKSFIKQYQIVGCAASAVHSVLWTTSNVFTFGKDNGQLGYTSECVKQIYPRKLSAFTDASVDHGCTTVMIQIAYEIKPT